MHCYVVEASVQCTRGGSADYLCNYLTNDVLNAYCNVWLKSFLFKRTEPARASGDCVTAVATLWQTMSLNKQTDDEKLRGVVTAGMAYRAKYRKMSDAGRPLKMPFQIAALGVHPKNRGGVYPAGIRLMTLLKTVTTGGFAKEECNHAGVCVEEMPLSAVADHKGRMSYAQFNEACSGRDELLTGMFKAPYDDIRAGTLSHSHLSLLLRAFMVRAQWNVPDDATNGITYCDSDGRLSITAVAAHPNCTEMADVLSEGLVMEVLSWKMDVEEPTAASIISQALNRGAANALRTTELTAVAVLKGAIVAEMSKDVAQDVAYATVKEACRIELQEAVDDPDFIEMFDFLISMGAGKNTYVDQLLQFAEQFVDSSKRQLRFAAIADANKICPHAPLSRIAALKQSYRKKPQNGFCTGPGAEWTQQTWDRMQHLEALLRHLHVRMKAHMEARLAPQSRGLWLANVDVAAADAFTGSKNDSGINAFEKTKKAMLAATAKYVHQIKGAEIKADAEWIVFANLMQQITSAVATEAPEVVKPKLIQFNEETGEALDQQIAFKMVKEEQKRTYTASLPWRECRQAHPNRGGTQADNAVAFALLQQVHAMYAVEKLPIDIEFDAKGRIRVIATEDIEMGALMIPPTSTNPQKVTLKEGKSHPHAIKLHVKTVSKPYRSPKADTSSNTDAVAAVEADVTDKTASEPDTAVAAVAAEITRESVVLVWPEWTLPKDVRSDAEKDAGLEVKWRWSEDNKESMHPFWAVRRCQCEMSVQHH